MSETLIVYKQTLIILHFPVAQPNNSDCTSEHSQFGGTFDHMEVSDLRGHCIGFYPTSVHHLGRDGTWSTCGVDLLLITTSGGMGPGARVVYKRLANHQKKSYSTMINAIRCRISFSLLRSAVMYLRGSRHTVPQLICSQTILRLQQGRPNYRM